MFGKTAWLFALLTYLIMSAPSGAADQRDAVSGQPKLAQAAAGPSIGEPTAVPVLTEPNPTFSITPKRKGNLCVPSSVEAKVAWTNCSSFFANRIFDGCSALIEDKGLGADCLAVAHFNRGTAHAKAGNYEKAVDDLSEAIALDWYYLAAYSNRGVALEALGAREAAQKDYAIALAIPADSELEKAAQSKAGERRLSTRTVTADDFVVQASQAPDGRMMPMARLAPAEPEKQPFEVVKVFYATDRKKTGSSQPNETFGGDRGELNFGICEVSIPSSHTEGQLEDVGLLQWREDPEKHILLQAVSSLNRDDFFKELQVRIEANPSKSALLFIHGFNTSFRDAARRTAQLSKDLKFNGAPVFYSWPSQANPLSYVMDSTNAEWSVQTLKGFLKDFATSSGADASFSSLTAWEPRFSPTPCLSF